MKIGNTRCAITRLSMRSIESDERTARTATFETREFRYADRMEVCASGSAPSRILIREKEWKKRCARAKKNCAPTLNWRELVRCKRIRRRDDTYASTTNSAR